MTVDSLPPTRKRTLNQTEVVTQPWYRDLRFSIGIVAAPVFFFAGWFVQMAAPELDATTAQHAQQAIQFIAGAVLLFPLATLIEGVTGYYEHNFHHQHDRNNALLRAGLLHTTFTNIAFLILTIFTLSHSGGSPDLVRIVQVSIAGSIVVSILFNLGVAIFIGGFNVRRHGGRMNFSKELANQDAEMITIAVVILSLPTLASHFNISPSFLDKEVYRLPQANVADLSVIISVILVFIYISYFFWTLLRFGDRVGQTTEDVQDEVVKTITRAVNKVFVTQGAVSFYDALVAPSIHYPDAAAEAADKLEIQNRMDNLDYSLEQEEAEESALEQERARENRRRIAIRQRNRYPITAPFRFARYIVLAVVFIVLSPALAIYRLVMLPARRYRQNKETFAIRASTQSQLPPTEVERRQAREQRRAAQGAGHSEAEPWLQVLERIVILLLGGGGAVYVLDQMAQNIEGGLVKGLGLNPFFVGFIVLPIATGLVDIVTATRKAWENDLQNSLAITTGSAVQSALLIGPLILIISRLPFFAVTDINLVFGLFILGIFGLIAYFYQIMTVDGETTWFEGAQLLGIFTAVAVVVFFAQKA